MLGHQDGWVLVERSDKMWSTGEGNGKPLQHSCRENPMNSMKRQNDIMEQDEPPGRKLSNMQGGESEGQLLRAPERMKRLDQSRNDDAQLWTCQWT